MSNKKVADLTTSGLEHTRAFVQSRIDAHLDYDLSRDLQTVNEINTELAKRAERASKINCSTCNAECDAPDPCPH